MCCVVAHCTLRRSNTKSSPELRQRDPINLHKSMVAKDCRCGQSGMTCTGTTHIGPPAQAGMAVEGKGARRRMICARSKITVPLWSQLLRHCHFQASMFYVCLLLLFGLGWNLKLLFDISPLKALAVSLAVAYGMLGFSTNCASCAAAE